ncbi:MAG TPA: type II secretion system protein GspG [Planctomycetota bacterium]|nr:type II secretion system protein GspG [Planctomycetota bacterium]
MRRATIAAAFLVLALPVAAQDRAALERDIEKAVERLYSEKGNESDLARQELTDLGRRAVPRLLQELAGKGGGDRKPNARVRRLICEILGESRDNSSPVLDALADRMNDTEEFGLSVAAAAAHALGRIADERSIPPLLKALNSKVAESDRWLKHSCIEALGILRAKEAVEPLLKALEDKGAAELGGYERRHLIRADAADALGLIHAKEAMKPLGKLLSDSEKNPSTNLQVAVHAARALERISGESKGTLVGSDVDIVAGLDAWRKWWGAEETKTNIAEAKARVAEIAAAVEKFKKAHGKYPAVIGELKTRPVGSEFDNYPAGGYYSGDLNDPWGMPYVYNPRGENGAPFDVLSYGRDKKAWGGGDDADIWNHENYKILRIQKTRDGIRQIEEAVAKFKADNGALPKDISDLTKADPAKNGGKAYLAELPKDGFDGPIRYAVAATKDAPYDIWSLGADRKEGGAGLALDIWNHDLWKVTRAEKTKDLVKTLGEAVEKFRKEQDRYPENLEDLKVKPSWAKASSWPDKGYTTAKLTDDFGNPFAYKVSADGKGFELKSLGGDGAEGGPGLDADIPYTK